jgi:hypothetical protein
MFAALQPTILCELVFTRCGRTRLLTALDGVMGNTNKTWHRASFAGPNGLTDMAKPKRNPWQGGGSTISQGGISTVFFYIHLCEDVC